MYDIKTRDIHTKLKKFFYRTQSRTEKFGHLILMLLEIIGQNKIVDTVRTQSNVTYQKEEYPLLKDEETYGLLKHILRSVTLRWKNLGVMKT